ncbi:hypothetical protein FLAPJACK_231 [Bacillus phage Flapjack]|uniref:Uncharacterized protein n=1 Tax=Bacillus phage Flapjack TaxID=1983465 RepID=A0A1X9SGB4_9CAUD|nr:hypothetical protein FLAPJACK_231 [Bacillus phage Flapjack]
MDNTIVMYVVTAQEDYGSRDACTLYAGLSQDEADQSINSASGDLEDFYKEIWVDGKKVRSYYKAYKNSDWSIAEGKTEDLVVSAWANINNLGVSIANIQYINSIKNILPQAEREQLEADVRNILGQIHSIYSALEEMRVPN